MLEQVQQLAWHSRRLHPQMSRQTLFGWSTPALLHFSVHVRAVQLSDGCLCPVEQASLNSS